jgi:hypothetical protein
VSVTYSNVSRRNGRWEKALMPFLPSSSRRMMKRAFLNLFGILMIVAVDFSGAVEVFFVYLPGAEGGGAESDPGLEVRVIQAHWASTVTPLAATVTRRDNQNRR